jgi:Domain of unknown function (DUF1906)
VSAWSRSGDSRLAPAVILVIFLSSLLFPGSSSKTWAQAASPQQPPSAGSGVYRTRTFLGFDRNEYPGDAQLSALRDSFAYAGYWLNAPPGESQNSWSGKRALLIEHGFGFLILFNGRLDAELRGKDAAALGRADAASAVSSAGREGFPPGAIVFLDQEEGGRLLPEQAAYVMAWVDAIRGSRYRPGVYCSGIPVREGAASISTAEDILNHAGGHPIALWVANDACPPSPGCVVPAQLPAPEQSGIPGALVWQYTQSPRRPFAKQCAATYAPDGNCYAPRMERNQANFLDLNVSRSADPSSGAATAR